MNNYSKFLARLNSSDISETLASEAGLARKTQAEIKAALNTYVAADGLCIPYHDLNGSCLLTSSNQIFSRYLINDERSEKECGEYPAQTMLPKAAAGAIYMPPGLRALLPSAEYLVVVIGELKALSAVGHGIACIGLQGAKTWRSDAKKDSLDVDLLSMSKTVGRVILLGDSDLEDHAIVKAELKVLATELRRNGVETVAVSSVPDYRPKPKKSKSKADDIEKQVPTSIGLDNWIAKTRNDLDQVTDFLDKLVADEIKRSAVLQSGGYIPLGHTAEGSVILSIARGTVMTISGNAIMSPGKQMEACDPDWVEAKFGEIGREGKLFVDHNALGKEIIRDCSRMGPFSDEYVIGSGVAVSKTDSDVLIVSNGMELWRTDGKVQPRVDERAIYAAYKPLGLSSTEKPMSAEKAGQLLAALKTWNWTKSSDALLLFGWIVDSFLCGAKDWRTHGIVTAQYGSGKSSLQRMLKFILGESALLFDAKTTEPGMRQRMFKDARACLIDEGETKNSNIQDHLNYLRTSSSGGEVHMGTSGDQTGLSFTLRSTGLISAVHAPELDPIDASRFVIFKLSGAPKSRIKHALVDKKNELKTRKFGTALFARMVHAWPRIVRAHELIADMLAEDVSQRYADRLAPLLASGWCALNDGEMTATEALRLITSIDMSEAEEEIVETDTTGDILRHVLGTSIRVTSGNKTTPMTVASACTIIANTSDKPAAAAIAVYGLKVTRDPAFGCEDGAPRLLINDKSVELKKLFRETKWDGANLADAFIRIPGAWPKRTEKAVWIAGETQKVLNLPIDLECLIDDQPENTKAEGIVSKIAA